MNNSEWVVKSIFTTRSLRLLEFGRQSEKRFFDRITGWGGLFLGAKKDACPFSLLLPRYRNAGTQRACERRSGRPHTPIQLHMHKKSVPAGEDTP
jgi:hypothetical protein